MYNLQLPRTTSQLVSQQAKPELKHLNAVAEAQNKAVPNFRTSQEYVTWLSIHGPQEAGVRGAMRMCAP
jgi:hypothetical protein